MLPFLRDVVLFAVINSTILGLLYGRYDISQDYLAVANDKLELLERTPPPRVLLVGGSSMAWSTHSDVLEAKLSRPVINCAYHAGLGLGFREQEVMRLGRAEDLVVLSIEWGVFPDRPRPRIVTELFVAAPKTVQFMNVRDRKLIFDGILPTVRMPWNALAEDFKKNGWSAFSRESAERAKTIRLRGNFNRYGDFVGHYGVPPFGFEGKGMELPTVPEMDQGIRRLNRLHVWCDRHQIQVVYFIPFIPEAIREDNPPLEVCLGMLNSRLTIPILNPHDFVMPDAAFFDSVYHLQAEPGRRRTELLADRLANFLADRPLP